MDNVKVLADSDVIELKKKVVAMKEELRAALADWREVEKYETNVPRSAYEGLFGSLLTCDTMLEVLMIWKQIKA